MAEGWHDPSVAPQQHRLASRELADWIDGQAHGPFDAFAECAQRIVFLRPQPRILDLGCGCGIWLELFRSRWPDSWVVGVDSSAPMVAFAQAQYGARGRVSYVQGDQRRLGFLDDSALDLVFHGCCLIHLPPAEWPAAIAEAVRVLAPDGYVIFSKTPIAKHQGRMHRHAYYGTTITEWSAPWDTFAEALWDAGLEAVWEEYWNEGADPMLVTTLARRRR